MNNGVDLHLHSTASDGRYTPSQLVQLALQKELRAIALTDHDTTDGIDEALGAAQQTGLMVIPGVEISTNVSGDLELHILGYHIDHRHAPLQKRLQELRESRLVRAREILRLLAKAGLPLSWEQVLAVAGHGSIGRPHIAQAMVEAQYVNSVENAFRLYLGRGGPAYVERYKLAPEDAIALVRQARGVPVLAHPSQVTEYIPSLVRVGLAGLEVYYNGYEDAEKQSLAKLASKNGLIATGGSDFHGPGITSAAELGQVDVPWSAVERLQAQSHASGGPRH
jgi:predicted metal-dependent phosphoesterase TrpH